MVTVQLRDESNPERLLIDHIMLPFEPKLGTPIYVFDRFEQAKLSFFSFRSKGKQRCYIATEVLQYEISLDDPAQSGIVYLAREVKP